MMPTYSTFVSNIDSNYWTRDIGLINFMVFPPKYYGQVEEKLSKTDALMYKLFYNRCQELILSRLQSDKSEKHIKIFSI